MPVLRHLHEQLDGQPISIILTDASGLVLTRMTAGPRPRARTSTGSSSRPASATPRSSSGTNGIGTALEGGRPMHVFGHEHYAEHLETLGLRRGADPPPDLRQDGRRGRPDLLAQGRRPAAAHAGQVHGRPDPPGRCWPRAAPASCGCSRSTCAPAGAPRGIVLALDNDVVDDERPRPHACSTRPTSPRCSATPPRRWPAGGPGADRGRAAQRRDRPDDAAARSRAAAGGGVVHVKIAGPGRARAGRPRRRRPPCTAARPGRQLAAVAAGLRRGRDGLPGRRVDRGRGRARRGQAGRAAGGAAAPAPGRPVRTCWTRPRLAALAGSRTCAGPC